MTKSQTLEMELRAPGMTPLHRAGLGGLWMTLNAIQNDRILVSNYSALGEWKLTPQAVTIRWSGSGAEFFKRLLHDAYPIRPDGLMWFLADHDPMAHTSYAQTVHEALLHTFLQHPKSKRLLKERTSSSLSVEIDGSPKVLSFRPVSDHNLRQVPLDPTRTGEVVGWLFPGGTERHSALGRATRLEEPPERLLPLRFGPVGCAFFHVRRAGPDGRVQQRFAVGMPELDDLEEFALLRAAVHSAAAEFLRTAGPGDASLRILCLEWARTHARRIQPSACEVAVFDTVAWSPQQRTRVSVNRVEAQRAEPGFRAYRVIRQALPARAHSKPDGTVWWSVPQSPELAAENVSAGRPWWRDFARFLARNHREMRYEQEGLRVVVQSQEALPDGAERAFVEACHEAWRRRLGELGERAKQERIDFGPLAGREYERVRIRFSRAKTAADFRNAITDFWARSGAGATLRGRWRDLLPFLDQRQWREGRDLALLALASYGGAVASEQDEDTSA